MTRRLKATTDRKSCPHCGGINGAISNERASGYVRRWIAWDGESLDVTEDKLHLKRTKTAQCSDCNRIIVNPLDE